MGLWRAKIAAKIVLSRVPVPRILLNKLGVFRHGFNAQAQYAYEVFKKHYDLVRPKPGFTSMELGPGDSLASAILTPAFDGAGSIQIDVAPFAREDVEIYRAIADFAEAQGRVPPAIGSVDNLSDVLKICNGRYLTEGLASLKSLPSASMDFIYSHAALEHVRASEFLDTMIETRRVLKPNGAASHQVDLRDHLDQSLNNLRFSDSVWESSFMANSGFYTNRISCSEMIGLMKEAGFDVEVVDVRRWDAPPLPRNTLAPQFRNRSDDDLTISGFVAVCRPI